MSKYKKIILYLILIVLGAAILFRPENAEDVARAILVILGGLEC